MKWYRKAAERGDAFYQNTLAFKYATGKGVRQDERKAVIWYQRAASQGFFISQYWLGCRYAEGRGVHRDYREAVKWYRKAAEREHAGAQYQLGRMYHQGRASLKREVSKEYNQTLNWYLKAAKQNHTRAHYSLGRMYAIHAYAWLAVAAEASPESHSPTLLGLESSIRRASFPTPTASLPLIAGVSKGESLSGESKQPDFQTTLSAYTALALNDFKPDPPHRSG